MNTQSFSGLRFNKSKNPTLPLFGGMGLEGALVYFQGCSRFRIGKDFSIGLRYLINDFLSMIWKCLLLTAHCLLLAT